MLSSMVMMRGPRAEEEEEPQQDVPLQREPEEWEYERSGDEEEEDY